MRIEQVDWRRIRRRFFASLYDDAMASGATTATVFVAIRRVCLMAVWIWQGLMIAAVLVEPGPWSTRAALVAAHLVLGVLAWLAQHDRCPGWIVAVGCYVMVVADWSHVASVDNPLALAIGWLANIAHAIPILLVRGRWALVLQLCGVVVVPAAMVAIAPGTGTVFPMSVAVTAAAMLVALRIGLRTFLDFTAHADHERALAEEQQLAVDVRRAASRRAAEDARVLHDTVINTLAAVASGGAAVADPERVRTRCARDVATLEALTADGRLPMDGHGIRSGLHVDGIRVVHRGLSDEELGRREALLPPDVLEAMARAIVELVRNAAKHSGAPEVVVDVAVRGAGLEVVVADDGVGFDGSMPTGRGLAESVLGRVEGTGIEVDIVSVPDHGTRARLSWDGREPAPGAAGAGDADHQDEELRRVLTEAQWRASSLFATALVGIGFWLAATNHWGVVTEEYPMAALVGVVCGIAWWVRRKGGGHGIGVPILLTAGACAAFVLSAAAVDFGRNGVTAWQAICPSGPLLMMFGERRWRRSTTWASALLATTIVSLALAVLPTSWRASLCVLIAGSACLGLVVGWYEFQRLVASVGRTMVADHDAARRLRTEADSALAASRSRRRWAASGLHQATTLLRGLADGILDPRDERCRAACAVEEAYLRQLIMLSPDLVQMGDWFARALSDARTSGARLAVRTGGIDIDPARASALGDLLLLAVAGTPAGAQLTSTLFPAQHDLRFTLVGPGPQLSEAAEVWQPPTGTGLTVRRLGAQDLVEVVLAEELLAAS